jgi:hypothetical protein
MTTRMVRKVQSIHYQRNGVTGEGFYDVRFLSTEGDWLRAVLFYSPDPEPRAPGAFDDTRGYCAVLSDVDEEPYRAWRGDRFEAELRAAIDADYAAHFGPLTSEEVAV